MRGAGWWVALWAKLLVGTTERERGLLERWRKSQRGRHGARIYGLQNNLVAGGKL